jgi:hypothetical protein
MKIYTKESLIQSLKVIASRGWIENLRGNNDGAIGNTLEDLLDIKENNLPLPNAAEWELKTHRVGNTSLVSFFNLAPSPRAIKFVPRLLLPNYGWQHKEAGKKYPENEMSFRQTIHGRAASDRGFMVKIDRRERKVLISFDSSKIDERHSQWKSDVKQRIGLNELEPQPYWGFDDLEHKAGTKMLNCFFVQAEVKRENDKQFFHYVSVEMLQKFSFAGFLQEIENANILVDFDARTHHDHGTSFRIREAIIPKLYEKATVIV